MTAALDPEQRIRKWIIENPQVWIPALDPDATRTADGWHAHGYRVSNDPVCRAIHVASGKRISSLEVFQALNHQLNCGDAGRVASDKFEALAAAAKLAGIYYEPPPETEFDKEDGAKPNGHDARSSDADDGAEELPPLIITRPETLQGGVIPPRRWAVPNWVPIPLVTGLYGDGGLGKTILLHMLLSSSALGQPWLDIPIEQMRAFGVFCEDPEEEMLRRQDGINRHYNVEMTDLGNMCWLNRFGMDNILMEFDSNSRRGNFTPFYGQLVEAIKEFQPRILILDTVADLFGGNENDRQQVRFFVQVCLGGLARMMDGAVIASAHPSRAGLKTGEGDSGSTAWNAGFRSRLYFSAPKQQHPDGEEPPDNNQRTLARKKANYAPRHEEFNLHWEDGVFVRNGVPNGSFVEAIDLDQAIVTGLRGIIDNGALVPADPKAPRGLANAVRDLPALKRYSWASVCTAQERLLKAGKLIRVKMGPPSRCRVYIRPADMKYPGEE